jgi:integrase
MITFKAIIIPGNRRKDGTYPVNIRVTFKGKTRRLATTLVCTQADLTRTLKIKNPTILNRSDALIARMRDAVKDLSPFDLENQDVDWVVRPIKDTLTKERFHLAFFEWSARYILTKTPTTRRAYTCALNTLERFLGNRSMDINDISRSLLLEFMEMVDNEPRMHYDVKTGERVPSRASKIPRAASSRHLAKLEHLFNAAKAKYNDEDSGRILIPRSPFSRITKVYPVSNGQSNLGQELMQQIISSQVDNDVMRTALDMFIVSFCLMGANMADLYQAKPFKGGEWVYNRQKTASRRFDRAEMRIILPDVIEPFLGRLRGQGGWWLNRLHEFASTKDFATARVNRCLKKWCDDNGVEVFTFYAARHTWASLARKEGVDKSTIDDALGHKGSFQVADIYAEKAWGLIREANRKVLELFTW